MLTHYANALTRKYKIIKVPAYLLGTTTEGEFSSKRLTLGNVQKTIFTTCHNPADIYAAYQQLPSTRTEM